MQATTDWFQSRVKLAGHDKEAVIDAETGEVWRYNELHQRIEYLARYFSEQGIQKGDRIALISPNHISYIDFLFACMKTGAIFVPLNWRHSDDELDYVIQDCSPKLIGVAPVFQEKIDRIRPTSTLLVIHGNDYIDQLLVTANSPEAAVLLSETDALAMIYTGGTTGRPKGVVLSQRSILWNAMNTIISWDLSSEDVTLNCLPMFHTGGLNVLTIPLLLAGGTVVISSDFEASEAVKDMLRYDCTIIMCVPTMYHMIIQTKAYKEATFPSMKLFLSGGAPCPHHIYRHFREKGIPFKEGYGLTEAGPNNFYIDPADTERKIGSVGKPMLFNAIKIIDDSGSQVNYNTVGEILINGNHTFEYYWNKPEQTKKTLVNGWLHTGDLARQDEEGFVYIVGRKKDMIITGGENVYPLEIEHWLEAHEGINEAAVMGIPDDKWGEIVVAYIASASELNERDLKDYCARKLSSYKIPKKFMALSELPKTHVGKINKALLKEKLTGIS